MPMRRIANKIDEAIDARDARKFQTSYGQTIEGCYACHKAAEKPYLRLLVPQQPEARVVNFDPHAKWPR